MASGCEKIICKVVHNHMNNKLVRLHRFSLLNYHGSIVYWLGCTRYQVRPDNENCPVPAGSFKKSGWTFFNSGQNYIYDLRIGVAFTDELNTFANVLFHCVHLTSRN